MPATNPQTPIGTANIVDNAVTTAKILDNAITAAKIAAGAIETSELADEVIERMPASYVIYTDGTTIYARSGVADGTDFEGTDAATVIQSALDALTAGRTWKEKVLLKGDFSLSAAIVINDSYTVLELRQATLTLEAGVNDAVIKTTITITDVEVLGGILDGNGTNQTGFAVTGRAVLHIRDVTRGLIRDVYVKNAYDRGIEVDGGSRISVKDVIVDTTGIGTGTGTGNGIMFWTPDDTIQRDYILDGAVIYDPGKAGVDTGTVNKCLINNVIVVTASSGNLGIALDGYNQILSNFIIIGNTTYPNWGLALAAITNCIVSNGYIYQTKQQGVEIESQNIQISNVLVEESVQNGFRVYVIADANIQLVNCSAFNCGYSGFDIRVGDHILLSGCSAKNNGQDAVSPYGFALSGGAGSNNVVISGCQATDDQITKTQTHGVYENVGSNHNLIQNNDLSGNDTAGAFISGANTIIKNNKGFVTENSVLSADFAIDAIAVITVTIAHGLDVTPALQDCALTVVESTNVDDWEHGYIKVESAGAANVVCKVNVTNASGTGAAKAKLALRVGKP